MSKTKIPNVVRGGVAIPLGRNLYYMKGRKHSQGGIDIGKNPRTGLEVEDGEIIQMKPKELRVLSAQKGIGTGNTSPAKAVLNGANPDKVFQAQENFKDRYGINDDGTKAEFGIKETLRKLFPNIAKAYDYITKDNDKKINMSEPKTTNKKTGQLPYGYTLRNLYKFENPDRKGIKRNIAYPYDSRTIGPGIDFKSGHPELAKKAKKGIPVQDVNDSAVTHLRKDDEVIMSNYADIYGKASADTVSHGPRFLAAQARYQQGNIRKAFPEIAKAMNKGDAKALKKAILKVTPKDHKYRRQLVQDYEVYPSKKSDGGMIQINGNVKNGLISTPRPKAKGGTDIHIKPSKRGTFTAAAKAHGKSVQGFASQVLANKDNYSSAMVKKANFARNASKWNRKACGGRKKAKGGLETDIELNPLVPPSIIVNKTPEEMIEDMMEDYSSTHYIGDPFSEALDYGMVMNKDGRWTRNIKDVEANPDFTYNMIGVSREEQLNARRRMRNQNMAIKRNEILGPGQYRRLVENPGDLTADEIIAATNTAERMGRNFNEDRARRSMNQNGDNTTSPSTGGDNGNTSGSTSSSSTTPRRRSTPSVSSNNYSVTNYEIQPDGTVKANGTRTGQGFKQYAKRKNQRTVTDAKVTKPWRETIGDDADVLHQIAFGDNFENKKVQDAHSKILQETGYNPKSGRAVIHEDVREYSRKFNERFNQANKKLGLYTIPAGKSGDNFYGDTKKCGGRKRAKDGLEHPYEDDIAGAQWNERHYGNAEDIPYLQATVDKLRREAGVKERRAFFAREDGKAGAIDAIPEAQRKYVTVAKPTIDLSPISKTVIPEAQKRATLKGTVRDKFNEGPTLGDWIGAGVNLGAGLGDFFGTNAYLNKFKSPDLRLQPHLKLKTYYNNNAEIDEINRNVENISRDIDANTASSSTALARKINARNNATMAKNKSWQNKFNIQDERINTERKLNSTIDGLNADRFNRWSIRDAAINNAKYQAKANNLGNLMGNISGTVNDVIARIEARRNFNNNLGYIQGANPNVDDRIYEDTGVQFDPRRRRYINTQKGITFMARCGKRIKLK